MSASTVVLLCGSLIRPFKSLSESEKEHEISSQWHKTPRILNLHLGTAQGQPVLYRELYREGNLIRLK